MPAPQNPEKTPADRVIDAFGGVESLAKAAKCSVWRVYRMRRAGSVPANLQGVILKAARKLGVRLKAEDLIDMREPEPEAAR